MRYLYNYHCISVNNNNRLTTYNLNCSLVTMSLGERLRKARLTAQLTQKQLAEKAGITQQMVSRLETGKAQGTTDIVSLAIACEANPEWLATGKGDMVEASDSRALMEDIESLPDDDRAAIKHMIKALMSQTTRKAGDLRKAPKTSDSKTLMEDIESLPDDDRAAIKRMIKKRMIKAHKSRTTRRAGGLRKAPKRGY
jgi:transcriptional regulator with XRE-family HTH domain